LAAPALGVCAVVAAQVEQGAPKLTIDSESFTLEGDLVHFIQPRITQASLRIEADDAFAMGNEFEQRSEWRFTGRVRITVERGLVEADNAVFTFENNQLLRGDLIGAPAKFTAQRLEPGRAPVEGSANTISLDYPTRTLRLSGVVTVHRDQVNIFGCDIVFDFKNENVAPGRSDCEEKFRFTFDTNNQQEGAADNRPAAAP
jgi:lipopolysaccharide transport protein LptA